MFFFSCSVRRGFSRSDAASVGFDDAFVVGADRDRTSSRSSVFMASSGKTGEPDWSEELGGVRDGGRCVDDDIFLFFFFLGVSLFWVIKTVDVCL